MNKSLVVPIEQINQGQLRLRNRATELLGSKRFLNLPKRVQTAIVPVAVTVLGLMNVGCALTGTGIIEEAEHTPLPYDTIQLGDGFSGTIVIGEEFGLKIRGDNNLLPHVRVSQEGKRLSVDLDDISHRRATLEAIFTMPQLASLELSQGSRFDARDLPIAPHLSLTASGGSDLIFQSDEDITAQQLNLSCTGGSTCSVTVFAQETVLEAAKRSRVKLQGQSESLTLYIDDASHVDAGLSPTQDLSFRLSNSSRATANASGLSKGRILSESILSLNEDANVNAHTSENSELIAHSPLMLKKTGN